MTSRLASRLGACPSRLGFGSFKIGRNEGIKYPASYELPSDTQVRQLLDGVLALGINWFDTAPAYGLAEERLGAALAHRRREIFLSTKVGEEFADGKSSYRFDRKSLRASVTRSLTRLRTDAVDLLLLHLPADDVHVLEESEAVPTLLELRDAGLARAIGISGKTVPATARALDWADAVMVEYHPLDISHHDVMAEAARRGVAVLVKKGLASGRLPPREAIPFVLGNPSVTSLVLGGLSLVHLSENVRIAQAVSHDLPSSMSSV